MDIQLTSNDLRYLLHQHPVLKRIICDVFTLNEGVHASNHLLHKPTRFPCAMIVNTNPSDKPGTHWVTIYIPSKHMVEYFDSFAENAPNDIQDFLDRFATIKEADRQVQPDLSLLCGAYCIFFLHHRSKDVSFPKIMAKFGPRLRKNDELVAKLTKRISEN